MTTIELFQTGLDTTGYKNEPLLVYYVPFLIILVFVAYFLFSYIGSLISSYRNNSPKHSFDADASYDRSFVQVYVGLALIAANIVSLAAFVYIRDTPRGENDIVDAVSYVPFDKEVEDGSSLKAQVLNDLQQSIADKSDVLQRYGLTDEACEDHKNRVEETSVLCGGDALTDVTTPDYTLHVSVNNDTEVIKDAEPKDKITTHDTLVWASVIAKDNE